MSIDCLVHFVARVKMAPLVVLVLPEKKARQEHLVNLALTAYLELQEKGQVFYPLGFRQEHKATHDGQHSFPRYI